MLREYFRFNDAVYDYFFIRNFSEPLCLTLDENVLEELLAELSMDKSTLFNAVRMLNWDSLFCGTPPRYLGIIALQIYVVSLSERKTGADRGRINYYDNSLGMFNIDLFSRYQERIWSCYVEYCETQATSCMPITGGTRYQKYPYSQAILSKEDFKQIANIWNKSSLDHSEHFEPAYLFDIIQSSANRHLEAKLERILNYNLKDYLFQQIANLYRCWHGEDYINPSQNHQINEKFKYTMFYIIGEDDPIEFEYADNEIELGEIYKRKISTQKFLIWKRITPTAIWELVPKMTKYADAEYCLTLHKSSYLISDLENLQMKHFRLGDFIIYHCKPGKQIILENRLPGAFSISAESQIDLIGGIKLDRNTWLYGAGPILNIDQDVNARINGKDIVLSRQSLVKLEPGSYRLVIINTNVFLPHFEIIKVEFTEIIPSFGWNLKDLEMVNENWEMSGNLLNLKFSEQLSATRDWIDAFNLYAKVNSKTIIAKIVRRLNGL